MSKEKFQLEYIFSKVSVSVLWNCVSTPSGLAEWFSDSVSVADDVFTFRWEKMGQDARLLSLHPSGSVRFHWLDDEDDESFFEFRIRTNALTGDVALTIVDFAEPDEKDDSVDLWNAEVERLRRKIGA